MKKIFLITFLSLASFIFPASFNEEEKVILKQEQRLEQERIQKEFEQREKTFENLNFEKYEGEEGGDEVKFYISKINLKDEEKLLNEIEKERILEKYSAKELGSAKITNLLVELTNKLIAKGYITTVATISNDNDLKTKNLNIEIVPGKIEKIILDEEDNLDILKKHFLFKTKAGEVLNVRDLDTTTENFNYLEANNMTMEIIPSEKPHHSIIKVTNQMKEKFTLSLLTNNHGEDRQNAIWRAGASINIDSPLGIGDRLYFSYMTVNRKNPDRSWKASPDTLKPGEILPIGPKGYDPSKGDVLPYKRVLGIYNFRYTMKYEDYSLSLGKSRTEKESSFYAGNTVYDFKSISDTFSVNIDKILWRNQRSKISFGIGLKRKHNENYLETAILSDRILSIGEISLSGSTALWRGLLGVSLGYERGLRALGAERDEGKIATTPKAQFNKYSLNLNYYKPISSRLAYRFNLTASHSNDVLYGSEKQSIGGVGSVGGFHRTGNIQGDKAVEVENELSYKILSSEKFGSLSPYISHSYGTVKNNENYSKYGKGHMSGLIVGLRYNMKYFDFDIAYARALNYSSYLDPRSRDIYFSAAIKVKF
ncbi:MAG: ShlB/FhaC/HecB family hemolysin secretion/activation protein [Fusobacterium sp.]|uniref:ShlB/FhaC/HecB family hemolysin secretion/activation protein n=1 Tax=Fusobacterium sp. TaxID=68766 RepID=UPI0026DCD97C|nr:ShlB/FhaC/HecB family hemolysin secretion/activation protein [Fusobacterium sp.]MDO4690362.1 ShlB/FhaC/HecB family hemolysin secretion/activation protein [Fusobacterium sp.]